MKKLISILLALSLLLLCVPSFAAGAEITSVTLTALSGGKIDVHVTAKNAFGAYFLAAAYSEDGSLLSSAELSDGNAVLNEDGVKSVKVFCWNNSESMVPLCAAYEARYIPGGTAVEGVILSYYGSDPYREAGDDSVTMAITKSSDTSLYAVGEIYSFSAKDAYVSPLLGCSVSATVRGNEILSVSEIPALNNTITVNTGDIEYLEAESLSYYASSAAKLPTEVSIENTVFGTEYDNVILNGFESELYPVLDIFDKYSYLDEITFLDNDNDGSFEFIFADYLTDSGAEFPVKSIDLENCYIEGIGSTGDFFIESDDYIIYTVIKDGEPASFEDITAGDVITVLDNSVYSITIYVSSSSVEGMISEIDYDKFTISDIVYTLSPHSVLLGSISPDDLSAGDEALFYINYKGKIAYADKVHALNYVYIIDAGTFADLSDSSEELIKVVTPDNTIETLTIKPRNVDLYLSDGSVLSGVTASEANEEVKNYLSSNNFGGIAKIETNSGGMVTAICFPGANGFEYTDKYANDAENEFKCYSEAELRYGTVLFDADTVLFNIDPSQGNLEDAVTAYLLTDVFEENISYSFIAYGDNIYAQAGAVVAYDAFAASANEPAAPSIDDSRYIYAVDCDVAASVFETNSYLIKAFTADGDIKIYPISKKQVYVFTDSNVIENVDNEQAYSYIVDAIRGSTYGTLLMVTTTASGYINGIWLPGANGFKYTDKYANDAENEFKCYSKAELRYGTVNLKESTIVFNIDTNKEQIDDAITVTNVARLFKNGSSYSFTAYGNDISAAAEVLVTVNADMSSLGLDPEAPVMVVTSVAKVVSDDDETYKITGIMDGSSVSVSVDPAEASSVSGIAKGNIIIFSENSSGFAENVHILFSSTKAALGDLSGVQNLISANTAERGIVNIAFGKISEKTSSYFQLEGITDEYGDEITYAGAAEGCRYILVEKTGSDITVKASTYSAVRKSVPAANYYAFVKTIKQYPDEVTDVVVFKGFD